MCVKQYNIPTQTLNTHNQDRKGRLKSVLIGNPISRLNTVQIHEKKRLFFFDEICELKK